MPDESKKTLPSCERGFEELKQEFEKVKAMADEYLNGWKRAKADFLNLQKDIERQRAEWIKFSKSGIILTILPIYESMEKLIESIENSDIKKEYSEGVKHIKKQFDDLFKNFGVAKIKTIGEKFDPNFHECVSVKKAEGKEAGEILEEILGGYLINGEVIRAAKVVVAE
jgi:molecular chaperone GrpE